MWITIAAVVGVVMVALVVGVWLMDAKRNEEVENDTERLDTDNEAPATDPTDPLHRRR